MRDIVVVTAAIGTTETPPPPPFVEPGLRYVCASNRECIPGWERVQASGFGEPRLSARVVKLTAGRVFSASPFVIWVDASFDWLRSPFTLAQAANLLDCDIAAFRHPDRCSIDAEAAEIVRCGLAPAADVARQVKAYKGAGFPVSGADGLSLTTTGLMVFRPSPRVFDFLLQWHEQVNTFTVRDQLSVDFCAWCAGVRIGYLTGNYRDNPFVRYNRERHRRRKAA